VALRLRDVRGGEFGVGPEREEEVSHPLELDPAGPRRACYVEGGIAVRG
jgi:hypothetical protein